MFHHGYCPVCGQFGYRPMHLIACYVEHYEIGEHAQAQDIATRAAQRLLIGPEPYLVTPDEIDLSVDFEDVMDALRRRESFEYDWERGHLHPGRFRHPEQYIEQTGDDRLSAEELVARRDLHPRSAEAQEKVDYDLGGPKSEGDDE
jgi:hypothetical protein